MSEWAQPPQGFATIPRSLLMDSDAPPDAKLVYCALSSHVGGNETAWPKQKTMATYLGISERQVRRALAWLRDREMVAWETKILGGMRSFNVYTLSASSAPSPANQDRTVSPVDRTVWPLGPDCVAAQERESLERESQEPSTSATADARPEVINLCHQLADRVEANGSKRPTIGKRWLDSCRLLIDADGRTVEQIEKAIDWCQSDEFWRTVILSMPTLRKQYDKLRLAAQRSAKLSHLRVVADDGQTYTGTDGVVRQMPPSGRFRAE